MNTKDRRLFLVHLGVCMMYDVVMGIVIMVWFTQLFIYLARAEFEPPAAARVHRVLKFVWGCERGHKMVKW